MKTSNNISNHQITCDPPNQNQSPLDTNEAAKIIGFSPDSVRAARSTGKLAGVPGPKFRQVGSKIQYEYCWLREWLNQFTPKTCTSDN